MEELLVAGVQVAVEQVVLLLLEMETLFQELLILAAAGAATLSKLLLEVLAMEDPVL
jgi:hypothetical protein